MAVASFSGHALLAPPIWPGNETRLPRLVVLLPNTTCSDSGTLVICLWYNLDSELEWAADWS